MKCMDYIGKLNDFKLKLDYIYSDTITTGTDQRKRIHNKMFRIPDTKKHKQ
jgi:hypothetical protein